MFAIFNHTCMLSTWNVPSNNEMWNNPSSCKRDTKSKSHVGMKLAPVRVFSCEHPLRIRWKERWVGNGTRFSWRFTGQSCMVFAFFSGILDWIVLILVWFERSLHSAQVSWQSWPWPLKLMTSRGVEGTWIRTGGSGAKGLKRPRVDGRNTTLCVYKLKPTRVDTGK